MGPGSNETNDEGAVERIESLFDPRLGQQAMK